MILFEESLTVLDEDKRLEAEGDLNLWMKFEQSTYRYDIFPLFDTLLGEKNNELEISVTQEIEHLLLYPKT